ncbi:hypothetical protein CSOJ01_04525 [Colletotrichum sojae]|uniref:Uncharacterized protein n=1 Tax=Colletotrichum sojae TaxID=2175907 RepID=A0A8H6JJA2_9PEZI|nr:hypothetical protein CSOJ01_04525 [Colletotrichum sojae]
MTRSDWNQLLPRPEWESRAESRESPKPRNTNGEWKTTKENPYTWLPVEARVRPRAFAGIGHQVFLSRRPAGSGTNRLCAPSHASPHPPEDTGAHRSPALGSSSHLPASLPPLTRNGDSSPDSYDVPSCFNAAPHFILDHVPALLIPTLQKWKGRPFFSVFDGAPLFEIFQGTDVQDPGATCKCNAVQRNAVPFPTAHRSRRRPLSLSLHPARDFEIKNATLRMGFADDVGCVAFAGLSRSTGPWEDTTPRRCFPVKLDFVASCIRPGVIAAKACATASDANPRRPTEAVFTMPGSSIWPFGTELPVFGSRGGPMAEVGGTN